MSDHPPARVEHDGPLAVIVIDHPPLNLFGEELRSFLEQGPGKATFEGR